MQALSPDLRERILKALQQGHNRKDTALRFQVSQSSLYRVQRQFKNCGHLCPKKHPGRGCHIKDQELPALETLVEQHRDPTGASLVAPWQETTGKRVGLSTMHRALHRLKFSFKKSAAWQRSETKRNGKPSATK
jgi:transposase